MFYNVRYCRIHEKSANRNVKMLEYNIFVTKKEKNNLFGIKSKSVLFKIILLLVNTFIIPMYIHETRNKLIFQLFESLVMSSISMKIQSPMTNNFTNSTNQNSQILYLAFENRSFKLSTSIFNSSQILFLQNFFEIMISSLNIKWMENLNYNKKM